MPRSNLVRAAVLAAATVAAAVGWAARAEDTGKPESPAFSLTFDEEERASEAAIRAVLARPVAVDIKDMPLREFFAAVKRDCGIPTFVDKQGFEDERVSLDTPVTLKLSGVSLKAALRWGLGPLQWQAVVREGVLFFTSPAEAVNMRTTRVYDVSDLVANERNPRAVLDALVVAIEDNTGGEPNGPWPDFDGEGHSFRARKLGVATVFVIEQTDSTHQQIGQLLRDIRAALKLPTAERQGTRDSGNHRPTPAARPDNRPQRAAVIRFLSEDTPDSTPRILEALERRVAVDFEEVPLTTIAETLSRMCDIPVVLNEQALIDEGVKLDVPITLAASGITLREALNLSLQPLDLRALVTDEVLLITTKAEAVNERTCRVYDVTDLLDRDQTTPESLLSLKRVIENNTVQLAFGPMGMRFQLPRQDSEEIDMQLISFTGGQLLVVRQTEGIYRQIDQLLRDLRAARARRVISITP